MLAGGNRGGQGLASGSSAAAGVAVSGVVASAEDGRPGKLVKSALGEEESTTRSVERALDKEQQKAKKAKKIGQESQKSKENG